eukprot:gene4374-14498_t
MAPPTAAVTFLPRVLHGYKWNLEWEEVATQVDLLGFDLMWYNGMGTGLNVNPDDRGVPALLRVKAVLLGNANGSIDTELSVPAFILAMSAARSAYTASLIWYGQVFQLHIIQGAAMHAI